MEQGRATSSPCLAVQIDCCEWANWGAAMKGGREEGKKGEGVE